MLPNGRLFYFFSWTFHLFISLDTKPKCAR
uniref:Uncharacterized protein n=1 Tax=Tetranychus urticae TaxID=32264 RepID=T1JTH2_TETUR